MASVIKISYKDIVVKTSMEDLQSIDCDDDDDELADDPPALLEITQAKDLVIKNLDGVFKCSRCSFSCKTTAELAAHYQVYRLKEPFKCFECGYDGRDKEDFVRHSFSHIDNNYFKCSKCEFKSKSSDDIKAHVQRGHIMDVFKCPLCGKVLANKWNLRIHIDRCRSVLGSKGSSFKTGNAKNNSELNKEIGSNESLPEEEPKFFTCTFCYYIFNSKAKLTKHLHNTHYKKVKMGEETNDVEDVKKFTKNKDKIDATTLDQTRTVNPRRNPKVNVEKIYLCNVCHFVFTSKSALNEHIVTHKNITDCPECGEQFVFNSDLKEHINLQHFKDQTLLCSLCDKSFSSETLLELHEKEHLKKRKYKCPLCSRAIATESDLRIHMETHSRVKSLCCPLCDFTAGNPSLLKKHLLKEHSKGNIHECKNCNVKYKYKHSLLKHSHHCLPKGRKARMNVEESPEIEIDISQKEKLTCSECKARFNEPAHLKRHLLIHFQNKPYRCMKCGLRCSNRGTFKNHMRAHSIKAFTCSICDMKFSHRSALFKHKVTHSDEKPYQCQYCPLNFKRKANYKRHCDIHSDIKPFECPYCSFTTKRKDGLDKHLRTHEKPRLRI